MHDFNSSNNFSAITQVYLIFRNDSTEHGCTYICTNFHVRFRQPGLNSFPYLPRHYEDKITNYRGIIRWCVIDRKLVCSFAEVITMAWPMTTQQGVKETLIAETVKRATMTTRATMPARYDRSLGPKLSWDNEKQQGGEGCRIF